MLVLVQDNRIMFKGHSRDDEVGGGEGQSFSAKGESEFIGAIPGRLGDGKDIQALQSDSQVIALGLGPATLEQFQDHDGAGRCESGRDAVLKEFFELQMAGSPEAYNPCGGIHQDAFSHHGASSLTL